MIVRKLYILNEETVKKIEELKKLLGCNSASEVIRRCVDEVITCRESLKTDK